MKTCFSKRSIRHGAAFVVLAMSSCVGEGYFECIDLRLLIRTDHEIYYGSQAAGRTTLTPVDEWYNCIESVRVYIFDENLCYVKHWDGPALVWKNEYEVPLPEIGLPEGVYTFVVWTNMGEFYSGNEVGPAAGTRFDEFAMHTAIPDGGLMEEDMMHRHHGILEKVYVSQNPLPDPLEHTIVIDPTVHRVNFTVNGLDATEDEWSLTVIDRNRAHDFRNTVIAGLDEYSHTHTLDPVTPGGTRAGNPPATRAGTASASTSMLLQQLHDDTDTTVIVTNETTATTIYRANLVEIIEQVYGLVAGKTVDFERTLEFDVSLNFTANVLVSITVDGWTYRLNRDDL
jgi:hypothetical protein